MTIRDILIWPHEVLDKPALPVGEITDEIRDLAEDLIHTCMHIGGVGLAAPQIGDSRQVFVLDIGRVMNTPEGFEVFVNPTQVMASGEVFVEEGCLSLPSVKGKVKRFANFGVEYTSLTTGAREHIGGGDILAQALQHEMDHLAGIVMVSKLSRIKRPLIRRKMKLIKRRMKAEGLRYHDVIRMPE